MRWVLAGSMAMWFTGPIGIPAPPGVVFKGATSHVPPPSSEQCTAPSKEPAQTSWPDAAVVTMQVMYFDGASGVAVKFTAESVLLYRILPSLTYTVRAAALAPVFP